MMRKHLLAAPVLLSFAGIASAQGSVTPYSIADAGMTYRSNEHRGRRR
ncbi:porin [Paraburkholderia lycopersici]|nr:porin [Paraburkholderia lycopersici]